MKKLLLLSALLITFFQNGKATHFAGGEIYYEYIGDSTGINFQYFVQAFLYFEIRNGVAGPPSAATICVHSSCFSSFSQNLQVNPPPSHLAHPNFSNAYAVPREFRCLDPLDSAYVNTGVVRYEGVITLSGKCADYVIAYNSCCRNSAISNLQNASTQGIFVSAALNNTLGSNSSPRFALAPLFNTCKGGSVELVQTVAEAEGDSVFFQNGVPQDPNNASCNSIVGPSSTDIAYASGYSINSPVSSSTGVNLNTRTGLLTFTPTQTEVVALRTTVSEFRYDTAAQQWVQVGEINREFQMAIGDSCRKDVREVKLRHVVDSLQYRELFCGDSLLVFKTSGFFKRESLAPNATDFAIIDGGGRLLPVVSATVPTGGVQEFAQFVQLRLFQNIYYDDTLRLVSRVGNDQNTLVNACGFELAEFDTLFFFVRDCQTGFSLVEDAALSFRLFPNPAQDVLNIEFKNAAKKTVRISNAAGQIFHQQTIRQTRAEIATENLPNGMYFLTVKEKGGAARTVKFFKN